MIKFARALVQTAPFEAEFREIQIPPIDSGAGLLRVEANGLCGSDLDAHANTLGGPGYMPLPRINGHEIVGIIEEISDGPMRGTGFAVGDRVAVNPFVSCGQCSSCFAENPTRCTGFGSSPRGYGMTPTSVEPQLWGGYSTHVYLHPRSVLHRVPDGVSAETATLWNPLAAGIQWAVFDAGLTIGGSIAVLGAGQRGLAAIAVSRMVGASFIAATGLAQDRHKLELATDLGADLVVEVDSDDPVEAILAATGGLGVDVVLDTTPRATSPLVDAVQIVKPGGVIAVAGMKGTPVPAFPIDALMAKKARLVGCLGQSFRAYDIAAGLLARDDLGLEAMCTHVLGYDRFQYALDLLRNQVPGQQAINVVITPTFENEQASIERVPEGQPRDSNVRELV